ncbi:hypothetical protein SUDANB105_07106 [Streptomyces sp. enrichment culture]
MQRREGAPGLTLEDVQARCRSWLAGYKIPRLVVLTDAVRRSPSGKADYRWARAAAASGADRNASTRSANHSGSSSHG